MREMRAGAGAARAAADRRGYRTEDPGEHVPRLLAEWRDTSTQLINHYGLVLGDPAHGQQLRTAMWEFLNLDEDDET